jgi:predicted SnoaL-like aldol condensation-catalyzing enzyme
MRVLLISCLCLSLAFGCSGNRETNESDASGGQGTNTGGEQGSNTGGAGPGDDGTNNAGSGGNAPVATGGASSTGGSATAHCSQELSDTNRALVGAAIDQLFVEKDLDAIDEYWSDPYYQHNPIAGSGVETFRGVMSSFVPSPSFSYERLRTLAECDLVVVQGNYSQTGIIFDMFRVQDGKIMEHWDSDSGHASTAGGSTTLTDFAQTAAHRAHVLAFFDDVLIGENESNISDYLSEDFVTHRPTSTDGPDALLEYLSSQNITYSTVHHVIADGNFVFTLSEGTRNGSAYGFYDLFRLAGGNIVEHWDSRRSVPNSTISGLPIF